MSKAKSTQTASLFSELELAQPNSSLVKNSPQRSKAFTSTKDLLNQYQVVETNKHIAHEFQSFGCYLAEILDDKNHTALYIKLAKTMPRGFLEKALSFVIDSKANNKARLFMWKLEQLKRDGHKQS